MNFSCRGKHIQLPELLLIRAQTLINLVSPHWFILHEEWCQRTKNDNLHTIETLSNVGIWVSKTEKPWDKTVIGASSYGYWEKEIMRRHPAHASTYSCHYDRPLPSKIHKTQTLWEYPIHADIYCCWSDDKPLMITVPDSHGAVFMRRQWHRGSPLAVQYFQPGLQLRELFLAQGRQWQQVQLMRSD